MGVKNITAHNKKGMTLIELMMVLVVLGILSGSAVPMYRGYRDDARRAEARGAIAAIVRAEQYYYQANGIFSDQWATIRNRVDLETEILNNWNVPAFVLAPANGFTVAFQAKTWVNRKGDPLQVQLAYDHAAGLKMWTDDTGMQQKETS